MKKILQLLSLLIPSLAIAQTDGYKPCIADSMSNIEIQNRPEALFNIRELEEFTRQFAGPDQKGLSTPGDSFTIPVVFHIMHTYGSENISKQQILDALEVLNLSFQKLNPDTGDVIQLFQPIFANPQIKFRLATIDPDGNCTDGITRSYTPFTHNAGTNVKFIHWEHSKYLNIWVVADIASGAAGYSYAPGVPNDTIDGVVILSTYTIGPSGGNYQSRSLTHEVGHYLNLPHTWGPGNTPGLASNCSIDDGVFDTPNCIGSTPSVCDTNQNTCDVGQPGDLVDNVQNYMDYAACHLMFTEGQKTRMHAALSSSVGHRSSLWTQSNLLATGTEDGHVAVLCTPKADFNSKPIYVCEGATVNFNDKSWRGDPTSWQWDFPGGNPSSSTSQNVSVQYSIPGIYDVTLIATNSAGSDTLIRSMLVHVVPDTGSNAVPFAEGFETISIPGNEWVIENNGTSNAFAITSAAGAASSLKSVRLMNQFNNTAGNVDALISPTFSLINVTSGTLSFKYAFAAKNATDSSFLKVFVSSNCGQTWTQRLLKPSTTLRTAPVTTGLFVPTAAQWAAQTVNLASNGSASVRVKFEYTQERGNDLYLDDININGVVGINEILADEYAFGIRPNPAHSSATLEMELKENSSVKIELCDVVGKSVSEITNHIYTAGKHQFEIQNNNYEGVYFVRVSVNENTFNQKMIFVK